MTGNTEKNVWLVTGAGRGLGVDIAQAALAAGHAVVATARSTESIMKALGEHADLLAVGLDVTDPAAAESAVAATVEGFMEGLGPEIAPFGIKTMLVEPGFFRTELLTPQSSQYAEPSIADYADRTAATIEAWQGMDGKQGGDPAKLAAALVKLAALEEPPLRFAAGADAVELFETKAQTLLDQANAHRELSSNLDHDDA
jgi:NAD(P)-dependent dehydrogenase (short-subunit alcohol dehydrogenase family)